MSYDANYGNPPYNANGPTLYGGQLGDSHPPLGEGGYRAQPAVMPSYDPVTYPTNQYPQQQQQQPLAQSLNRLPMTHAPFDYDGLALPAVTPVTQLDCRQKGKELAKEFIGGIADDDLINARIDAAMREHNPPQLDVFNDSIADQEARLGSGVRFYFTFIKFLGILSVVFAALQCATYGHYVQNKNSPSHRAVAPSVTNFVDDLTITVYVSGDLPLWQAMNIVCIILAFLAAPIYFLYLRVVEKNDDELALSRFSVLDKLIRFTPNGEIDVSNTYRSSSEKVCRRVTVFIFILMMIGLQVIASILITTTDSSNIGIAFAISFIAATLNIVFSFVAYYLTEFEKWDTFYTWNAFHTLKLLAFKLANIITVFAAKKYSQTSDIKCTYSTIGEQLITLLLVEIFAVNLQKILTAMFFFNHSETVARWQGSIFGDQDNLPQFDLSLEYLSIIYRHYLTLMAMVTLPYSILLSLFGYVVQYWVEKYYLYKLCGVPRKTDSSMKTFLTILLAFVALCSLLTPFAGTMFVLSGLTKSKSSLCLFP